jgi:hypothetical protein
MGTDGSSRGGSLPPDPTAAEHTLTSIENGGLARRYRSRRSIENE